MLRSIVAASLLTLALSAGAVQAQTQDQTQTQTQTPSADQSTRWQVTVSGQMTQPMAVTIPEYSDTVCGPAEPLAQSPPMNRGQCQLSDYRKSGDRATYTVTCNMAQGEMTGSGWAQMIDADHYKGHMRITGTAGGMAMQMEMDYSGTRIGACGAAESG